MVDLLIRGGDVVDVRNGTLLRSHDVAVERGVVVAVGPALPGPADRVVDVAGSLVAPGLVDMHTHVFAGGGYYGLDPDAVAWRSGVTTWVDAGSAGAYTLGALLEGAARRTVRVPVLLNVSAIGLAGESYECRILENCVVDRAVEAVEAHRGVVVGIKARVDHNTVGDNGVEPLHRALHIGRETGLPVMAHIGAAPPSAADVLRLLRAGDVVTHCATGVSEGLLDEQGRVTAVVRDAYDRGVRFDVGHGVGGFGFDVMEALLEAGCVPHTVSSDLHATSVSRGAFDLPTVMTKMLAVGMDLLDVLRRATRAPAEVLALGDDVGVLTPGAPADIAVLETREALTLSDAYGARRRAPVRLVATRTFLAGTELTGPDGARPEDAWPDETTLATPGTYRRGPHGGAV